MRSGMRMAEIRKDPLSESVVIYSPGRENRPDFTGIKKSIELSPENCPFCRGNEDMTPPEIYRIPEDSPDWKVRVIPNKFPVLNVEERKRTVDHGIYKMETDAGAHEIIIETPDHSEAVLMGASGYRTIFTAWRNRINDLKRDIRFRYVQVFKNHKAPAGATISHHHSQLIALPFVPDQIKNKVTASQRYFSENGRTVFDDMIRSESEGQERTVYENGGFIAVAPWYSRTPFQVSIYNHQGHARFEDIQDRDIDQLSELWDVVMGKINRALGDPAMNIGLINSPFGSSDPGFSWYLEILPLTGGIGGFEAVTGTYINPVMPEKAASILKKV